jgi:iron complex outermembrane receptor protein
VSLAVLAAAVRAQPSPEPPAVPAAPAEPSAAPAAQQVEIRGTRSPRSLQPDSALAGEALRTRQAATLGATLEQELGVANASFGPNVGLPLVRGQGGSRVRAMVGGIGTFDASSVSADHGAMVEPGIAERITVLRGPAVIRFGGTAAGGAVEIDDGRITEARPERAEARVQARGGTGEAAFGFAKLRSPLPAGFVLHADVHARRQGDARIGGPALDEAALREQFGLVTTRNTFGFVENTSARSEGGSIGVGVVPSRAFTAGIAVSSLRIDYGIPPGGHSHGGPNGLPGEPPPTGTEAVRIRARQERVDGRVEWSPAGLPGRPVLRVRAGGVRYAHDEVESGRVGTTFRHDAAEWRAEAELRPAPGFESTVGVQFVRRTFSALGEESYVPRTHVASASVFTVQRHDGERWSFEAGGRFEAQKLEPDSPFEVIGLARELPVRRFRPGSVSFAVQRRLGDDAALTLSHWIANRAPDVQELYAGGPHVATRSFDFGNTALVAETVRAWDLALRWRRGAVSAQGNVWAYRSPNYIWQRLLGWYWEAEEGQPQAVCARLEGCLPATKREQAAARLAGFEFELAHESRFAGGDASAPGAGEEAALRLRSAFFADALRARLAAGGDLPRMPAPRWGLAFEAGRGAWQGELRFVRHEAQRHPGAGETPTAASLQWHASLRHRLDRGTAGSVEAFLVGRNLGDRNVRNAASFLRSYAPEPGRSVQVGIEWNHW